MNRFRDFGRIMSQNNTRTCWVLKCDIRKFFASVVQGVLLAILRQYIPDQRILRLLKAVITSFESENLSVSIDCPIDTDRQNKKASTAPGKGLPLGNLTSQLLVNIYMNEFDQFVKHSLKAKYYVRYADDFVTLSPNRRWLESLIPQIAAFLSQRLKLELHPEKLFLQTLASGVDFLGWVHFPDHRVLRTATKRRMMKRLEENRSQATLNSYFGLLSHGNTEKLQKEILDRGN